MAEYGGVDPQVGQSLDDLSFSLCSILCPYISTRQEQFWVKFLSYARKARASQDPTGMTLAEIPLQKRGRTCQDHIQRLGMAP